MIYDLKLIGFLMPIIRYNKDKRYQLAPLGIFQITPILDMQDYSFYKEKIGSKNYETGAN